MIVNSSFLCCPQYPSPFNFQYCCSCHAPNQTTTPSCCPGGWKKNEFLRVLASRSVVHASTFLQRSNGKENSICFLHLWRCCIPANCMGRAPDQCRQGRGALVGQIVSKHCAALPASNSPTEHQTKPWDVTEQQEPQQAATVTQSHQFPDTALENWRISAKQCGRLGFISLNRDKTAFSVASS